MVKIGLLVLILTLYGQSFGQVIDQTRQPEARGSDVVEAVVDYIRESCIFPDDKLYLRRLAYVESEDGLNSSTYRPGYYGGIWQVDQNRFSLTQTSSALNTYRDDIQQKLAIDWSKATWADLTKPLYSGLAAALYTTVVAHGPNNIPRGIEKQSTFWKSTTRPNRDANVYYTLANKLQSGCTRNDNLDLAFILDSSASLSGADFNSSKQFVSKVVDELNVGNVRISVVQYSTSVSLAFYLNTYKTKSGVKKAVEGIQKSSGSTRTDLALDFAVDNIFTIANGGRAGVAKVLILVTDGLSDNRVATVTAAARAKARGINVFAIGVTPQIDQRELESISSLPKCTHVQTLSAFSDLDSLVAEIQQVSCSAPSILISGTYTYSCGTDYNVQFIPDITVGTTVTISVSSGSVNIFGSLTQTPSVVKYEFKETASAGSSVQLYIKDKRITSLALVTSGGTGCNNNFNVKVERGNRIGPQNQIICIEGNLFNRCNATNLIHNPYMTVNQALGPNYYGVCAVSNSFLPDPYMNNRFLYCNSSASNPIIFLCPLSKIFEPLTLSCVVGIPISYTAAASTTTRTIMATNPAVPITTPRPVPQIPANVISSNPCTPDHLQQGLFYFPYPGAENKYIECYNVPYLGTVKLCAANHYWSESKLACLYKNPVLNQTQNTYVIEKNPCGNNPTQFFYPYPIDQHYYIHCDEYGDAFLKKCQNNFTWMQTLLQCVPRGLVTSNSTIGPLPGKK